MIIVCGNTRKGGGGKSTIATNLAVDLTRHNIPVKLLDLDPDNACSMDFYNNRKDKHNLSCIVIDNKTDLIKEIDKDPGSIKIVDIGGLGSELTATAIAVAQVLFIPFRVSSKDLTALITFIGDIEDIFKEEKDDLIDTYLVPNFLGTKDNEKTVKDLFKDLNNKGYPVATTLKNRSCYIKSADDGLSVTEYGNMKAAAEIYGLVEIILRKLDDK